MQKYHITKKIKIKDKDAEVKTRGKYTKLLKEKIQKYLIKKYLTKKDTEVFNKKENIQIVKHNRE